MSVRSSGGAVARTPCNERSGIPTPGIVIVRTGDNGSAPIHLCPNRTGNRIDISDVGAANLFAVGGRDRLRNGEDDASIHQGR
jgi:hypothetical protein